MHCKFYLALSQVLLGELMGFIRKKQDLKSDKNRKKNKDKKDNKTSFEREREIKDIISREYKGKNQRPKTK